MTRLWLRWRRWWLTVLVEIDEDSIEVHQRSLALNAARLKRVQQRYAEITPAHILLREMGKSGRGT